MLTVESFEALRSVVAGNVVLPGDARYQSSKSAWNLTIEHCPSAIVEAETIGDIQAAVRFAASQGLPISVQTTGHGQPRCCDGGILLRVDRLNSVSVDAERRVASVGGGAVWGDVIAAAVEHRLAPISGSSPGVGVVGYLVGGGFGLMSRKYGLAVDNLVSAKMVLADGSLVRVSAEENSELFWAIRGGGGAFGVIVELEIGLVPHGSVFGGNVMFDASNARQVLTAWSEWSKTSPNEITSALIIITFPPVPFVPEFLHGRSMVIFAACAACSEEEGIAALAPIRNLPGVEFDSFRWMSYAESGTIFNDPQDPLPAIGTGAMLREFGEETIDAMLEAIGPIPQSPSLMIQIRQNGGAIRRVPSQETSLGDRRSAEFLTYFLGVPMGPYTPDSICAHGHGCLKALQPWAVAPGPLNWVGEGNVEADTIKRVFDAPSFERLLAVKRNVDLHNVFSRASMGIWRSKNLDR